MDFYYIYKITNNLNGKIYIGQHKYNSDKYTDDYESLLADGYWGSGILIKRAIKKHGKNNFTKDILVSHLECKEAADEAEKVFIKCYRELGADEYNLTDGGDGSLGRKLSEEAKEKLAIVNRGKVIPEETRKKISETRKGTHASEETRHKLSEIHIGSKHHLYGKHRSDAVRKKISEARKGCHWYNNGELEVFQFECPDGFVSGRIKQKLF